MEGISTLNVVLLFLCVGFSAFFSSSETAFISLQKIRLRHLVSTGVGGAERVSRMVERPEKLLATILVGNNFVNTAAAVLGTMLVVSLFERGAVLIATLGVATLLLLFGEIAPKTLATRHGERLAFFYARPVQLISWVLTPVVTLLGWFSSGVIALTGGASGPESLVREEEIRTTISVGRTEGTVEEREAEMLERVFRFGDRHVREAMVPRTEIVWVEEGARLSDFLALYARFSHTRFPVYKDSIDNVVGVLSIKDVLRAQAQGTVQGDSLVTELARPPYFVPETKHVGELFAEMRAVRNQMAVVVDEFGGMAGLVTLKQLVEEIVGPVGDEMMETPEEFETLDERTVQVDGGMRLEEANEKLGLGLPAGQYETVAGFVLSALGHIPQRGEQLRYNGLRIVVSQVRGVKIERILIIRG